MTAVEQEHLEAADSYETYRERMDRKATTDDPASLAERDRRYHDYIRLNKRRTDRLHEGYRPSRALREAVRGIEEPQTWLVVTEDWCGDSAQMLPVIAEAAGLSARVDLRILARDEHIDLIDAYQTDGKRAIPKLIALTDDGTELFTYGPRPTPAAELFADRRREGVPREEIYRELQEWYNEDGGTTVDRELTAILRRIGVLDSA